MKREEVKRLFLQHYAKMYRVARTFLYDEQASQDVVSEVFERLLAASVILRPDTEEDYLMTCVRNECVRYLLREEAHRRIDECFASTGREDCLDDIDGERLGELMDYAVAHLSEQEYRIFLLRFREGLSYQEIADAEHISRVAVWKHISHFIQLLRKQFNPTNP